MEAPRIRYRRQPFMRRRIDIDRPLGPAARLYKAGTPVVLARLERTRALEPERTVPVTLHELRRQIDIERGMWEDRRDIPSALAPSQTVPPDQATYQSLPSSPETMPTNVTSPDQYGFQPHTGIPRTAIRGLGAIGVTAIESRYSPRASAAEYSPKLFDPHARTAADYRPKRSTTPALLAPVTALRGLGASDESEKAAAYAAGIVVLGLAVGGGYFAGAAMAPASKDKMTYGVLGSVLGLFTGPIGLGVLGLVALSRK